MSGRGVTETASVQHSCPPEQIRILSDNGDGYARVVQLDVCGQRRVYQDQGGRDGFVWVRAHIAARASAILACRGGAVAVDAQWDPSRSTTVALSARGVSDAAIAECIGAAIGSIAVPSDASPGRLVHAVSN